MAYGIKLAVLAAFLAAAGAGVDAVGATPSPRRMQGAGCSTGCTDPPATTTTLTGKKSSKKSRKKARRDSLERPSKHQQQ
jgi:hypothetical protein